jgi:transposase
MQEEEIFMESLGRRYRQSALSKRHIYSAFKTPPTAKEQDVLRKKIEDKHPEQLKLSFALWTREAVCELIVEETGKRLDLRQVGRYLKRWGLHTKTTH